MKIEIDKNPNFSSISRSFAKLKKLNINIYKLLNKDFLDQLNPNQFIYLIGITAYEGKNFHLNFKFIQRYISRINIKNINLLLNIEGQLYNYFLKRYETEEAYQIFCSFFESLYKKNQNKTIVQNLKNQSNEILFFIHAPVFLAHTNPLLYMLKNRKNFSKNITITSLTEDEVFTRTLTELNVKFVLLKGKTLLEQLNFLVSMSNKYKKIVWQSVPLYLGYVSKSIDNVCLWSFKFHPKFKNVKINIGSFQTYDKKIIFKGNIWKNIDVGFDIKNLNNETELWENRKLKFGAFCREELIDTKDYWSVVKIILEIVENSIFFYCGRKNIHTNWLSMLKIPPKRVVFLGWLEKPYLKLKEMSFLLDGFKLGHGYIAYEAMAANVPIVFPSNRRSYGTLETYINKLSKHSEHKHLFENSKNYFLKFKNNKEAAEIALQLMTDEKTNSFYGKYNNKLISLYPKDNFEDFQKVIFD